MEAELLAGVIQTDTHKRLQVADQLLEYFKKDAAFDEFPDFDSLISGLSSWIGSSNFRVRFYMHIYLCRLSCPYLWQVSVSGMQVMEVIVTAMKANFRPHLSTSKSCVWCALYRNGLTIFSSSSLTEGEAW